MRQGELIGVTKSTTNTTTNTKEPLLCGLCDFMVSFVTPWPSNTKLSCTNQSKKNLFGYILKP